MSDYKLTCASAACCRERIITSAERIEMIRDKGRFIRDEITDSSFPTVDWICDECGTKNRMSIDDIPRWFYEGPRC